VVLRIEGREVESGLFWDPGLSPPCSSSLFFVYHFQRNDVFCRARERVSGEELIFWCTDSAATIAELQKVNGSQFGVLCFIKKMKSRRAVLVL
jgi:hypothetical protein